MSSSDSSNDSTEIVSEKIREAAKNVSFNLLPRVSKQLYTAAYNAFKKWRKENGTNSFCEDVMLAYFDELSKKYAPSSLWSIYSMLKSTTMTFNQIDISNYKKLILYLKRKSSGHQPKKSLVFTKEAITKFLNEAPDEIYLSTKVALIFGISGALRRREFTNIKMSDITQIDDLILVKITVTKNKQPRSFTITDHLFEICKKYIQARPPGCSIDRFFLKYSNGKCIQQPIGINSFGSMPRRVASYLNLPDADKYTGHSFRRTSATFLADAGADITQLKRHGGWNSTTVAEGYIADSIGNKKRIHQQISSGITLNKKTKVANVDSHGVQISVDSMSTSPTSNHPVEAYIAKNNEINNKNFSFETPSTSYQCQEVQVVYDQVIEPCMSNNYQVEAQLQDLNKYNRKLIDETLTRCNSVREKEIKPDIVIAGDSVIQNTSESGHIKIQSASTVKTKYPVFYDPDLGLYILESKDWNSDQVVFNNCNVKIEGGSHKSIILNNCNIYK